MTAAVMLILALVFLALSGLLMLLFRLNSAAFFPLYRRFSAAAMKLISSVTGILPFALWEWLLLLLLLGAAALLVYVIIKKRGFLRWLTGLLLLIAVLCFLFVVLWGLNHYAPPLSEELGLDISEYSEAELLAATEYYMSEAGAAAEQCSRTDDGLLDLPDFSVLAKEAGTSFSPFSSLSPLFENVSTAPVKKARLTSRIMSYTGYTGIIIAWTAESTVNPDTYCCSLPFTMCHEVAHRCGIGGEDEANFAAYLACVSSDDEFFRYSGWYSAFIYCYNALYKADRSAALALWTEEYGLLRQDCAGASAHYAPYKGAVQDAAQKGNDAYLKAFSEESGVQSYGEAVDYFIAWYLKEAE